MTSFKDNFSADLEQIRRNEIENLKLIESLAGQQSELSADIEAIRQRETEILEIIERISEQEKEK